MLVIYQLLGDPGLLIKGVPPTVPSGATSGE